MQKTVATTKYKYTEDGKIDTVEQVTLIKHQFDEYYDEDCEDESTPEDSPAEEEPEIKREFDLTPMAAVLIGARIIVEAMNLFKSIKRYING